MTALAADDPRRRYFEEQLAGIDLECLRQAMLCGVRVDDRSNAIRVLENDESVCTKPNPAAFRALRAALTMHFTVRDRAFAGIGHDETMAIVDEIVARLKRRVGLDDAKR